MAFQLLLALQQSHKHGVKYLAKNILNEKCYTSWTHIQYLVFESKIIYIRKTIETKHGFLLQSKNARKWYLKIVDMSTKRPARAGQDERGCGGNNGALELAQRWVLTLHEAPPNVHGAAKKVNLCRYFRSR
jgi:hypothetical protein